MSVSKRFMWVYHLGSEDESGRFKAEVEIYRDSLRLSYSGQVHSLATAQTKVNFPKICFKLKKNPFFKK